MAIKTDRSDLPPGDTRQGIVPDQDLLLVHDLVAGMDLHMQAWRAAQYGGDGITRPMAGEGSQFRHSDAAGCARQLAYKMAGTEMSNPPGVIDRWNMFVGTILHEQLDAALRAKGYPESAFEVECGFTEPFKSGGHADLFHNGVCGEYKTQTGTAYKMHVGDRGKAAGPAWGAIVQGSLNAVALGADELVIVDVAKELISKGLAEQRGIPENDRGVAGWRYTPDQFAPVAEREKRRVRKVLDLVAEGGPCNVPRAIDDPEIPREARIVDPLKGRWEVRSTDGAILDTGEYWNKGAGCAHYCAYKDRCAADLAAERAAAA